MDSFNKSPAISEDTLQYAIYPSTETDQPSVTSLAAVIMSFVQTTLPGFIWLRDAFKFEVKMTRNRDERDEQWMLEGTMRVGDCVDDEWCVIWLLREISSKWDVAIRYECLVLRLPFKR